MLLNLQQFAYDQIAALKVNFTTKLETMKESYSEEIEELSLSLAEACRWANSFSVEAELVKEQEDQKEDNSGQIIQELKDRLEDEQKRSATMAKRYDDIDKKYQDLTKEFEELTVKHGKLEEKWARETDLKLDLKERLDEIENKYQNVSISTMHAKISSLKSQLDLQKLEDAKKLYDKDKKMKKAVEALKAFKEASKNKKQSKEGEGEGDEDDEGEGEIGGESSPTKSNMNLEEIQAKMQEESEEEDPAEIERNIKKMLQEEEELKKEQEEAQQEEPPPEINNEDDYQVDRDGFEQAIQSNPMFENVF